MMCHTRRVNYSSAISFVSVQQKKKIPSHLHRKFWIHSILVGGSGHVTAMSLWSVQWPNTCMCTYTTFSEYKKKAGIGSSSPATRMRIERCWKTDGWVDKKKDILNRKIRYNRTIACQFMVNKYFVDQISLKPF